MPGLTVIEPFNDHIADTVDYRNFRLLKKSSFYDDDAAKELHEMAKKIAVKVRDRTISGKDPMSIFAFLQKFKSVCEARGIHESTERCLLKKFLLSPAEVAVEALVTLTCFAKGFRGGALKTYSAVFQLLVE